MNPSLEFPVSTSGPTVRWLTGTTPCHSRRGPSHAILGAHEALPTSHSPRCSPSNNRPRDTASCEEMVTMATSTRRGDVACKKNKISCCFWLTRAQHKGPNCSGTSFAFSMVRANPRMPITCFRVSPPKRTKWPCPFPRQHTMRTLNASSRMNGLELTAHAVDSACSVFFIQEVGEGPSSRPAIPSLRPSRPHRRQLPERPSRPVDRPPTPGPSSRLSGPHKRGRGYRELLHDDASPMRSRTTRQEALHAGLAWRGPHRERERLETGGSHSLREDVCGATPVAQPPDFHLRRTGSKQISLKRGLHRAVRRWACKVRSPLRSTGSRDLPSCSVV